MNLRTISKVTENPWRNGFLGTGHLAKEVLGGTKFTDTDPFIFFMDDSLDLPGGEPVGGAHPHAGFETLTLVLQGNENEWQTGSFELMTAGKGIVHTEEITSKQKIRILQVWLVLPREKRYAQPFWQKILLEDVPTIKTDHSEIRVYSGSSNGLTSPLKNHTPLILVDFKLNRSAEVTQELPSHFNGLVYVINGRVKAGDKIVGTEQAGWINSSTESGNSKIEFIALDTDTRFVLYAGQPDNFPVVQHGPFVADSMEDIAAMYSDFRKGQFPHVRDLPESQKIIYSAELK